MKMDSGKPDLVHYRDLRHGEEAAACGLVFKSFDGFVAPGYGEEGQEEFR